MTHSSRRRIATTLGALILGLGGLAAFGDETSASFRSRPSGYGQGGSKAASAAFNDAGSIEDAGGHGQGSTSFRGRSGFVSGQAVPSRVSDLAVDSRTHDEATLSWTAPFADGERSTGTVAAYIVKYSTTGRITNDADFATATLVTASLSAQPPSYLETFTIGSLASGVTHYFAVEAVSADGVRGELSVEASTRTLFGAGCAITKTVQQAGGADHTTISAAVNALPAALSGGACVVVLDGATYAEGVTIQNFTNAGYRLTIFANPASGLRPKVTGTGATGAAFVVRQDTVTIAGFDVVPNAAMPYGVFVASEGVVVSSVNVLDAGGLISASGIQLASRNLIEYSSVTISGGAISYYLSGLTGSTVAYSSGAANGSGAALYLTGVSSSLVTNGFFRNAGGDGAVVAGNSYGNQVTASTLATNAASSALYMASASSNVFTRVYFGANDGVGLHINAGAVANRVEYSTVANNTASYAAFYTASASSNTFDGGVISNPQGGAAQITSGSRFVSITRSTVTTGAATVALYVSGASSATIHQVYARSPATAIRLSEGADSNVVSHSTGVGGATGVGLYLENSSSNTIRDSSFRNASGDAGSMFAGSDNNSVLRSSFVTTGTGYSGLYNDNASSNTFAACYFGADMGTGLYFDAGSEGNTVSGSVMVSTGATNHAFILSSAASNTVTNSWIYNRVSAGANGMAAYVSPYLTVSYSTFVTVGYSFTASAGGVLQGVDMLSTGDVALYVQGSSLTIAGSTVTATASNATAIQVLSVSSVTIRGSRVHSALYDAIGVDASHRITLMNSTVTVAGGGGSALYASGGSSITVQDSILNVASGYGLFLTGATAGAAVRRSTVTSADAQAASVSGASDLEIERSFFENSGTNDAMYLSGVIRATITFSTITAGASAPTAALQIEYSSAVTVAYSYLRAKRGAWTTFSTNTVVMHSHTRAIGSNFSALLFTQGNVGLRVASNTIVGGDGARGVYVDSFGGPVNMGEIHVVTNTISGAAAGVEIGNAHAAARVFVASNTAHPAVNGSVDAAGVYLYTLPGGATVQNNSIYYRASGSMGAGTAYGVVASAVPGLLLTHNRVNNPGMVTGGSFAGVRLDNSPSASIFNNDVHSTGTALTNAHLVRVLGGSTGSRFYNNIVSSSFTVTGASATIEVDAASATGFLSDYNSAHSSNAYKGGLWAGTWLGMLDGAWMFVTGNDRNSVGYNYPAWRSVGAGVEDFHLQSRSGRYNPATQTFVNDQVDAEGLDGARPGDSFSLEPVSNGGRRNQGSYGDTAEASKSLDYGCSTVRRVNRAGGNPYDSIDFALTAIWPDLTGHACVVVQDSSTYPEQVTVQNFVNNGSSITIFTEPSVGSYATVDPPAGSTAAFDVRNASVSILGMRIGPTVEQVAFGVRASSAQVRLSSVSVDSGGMIWYGGVALSSWSTVSDSSVTVQAARALRLEYAVGSTIERSTLSSAGSGTQALNTTAGSSHTVRDSWIYNAAGWGCVIGSSYTTIERTTVSVSGVYHGCETQGNDNLIQNSYLYSAGGSAYANFNGASRNRVDLSTAVGASGAKIANGVDNILTRSVFRGLSGRGVESLAASARTVISFSTAVGPLQGFLSYGSSASVYNSYIQGSTGVLVLQSTGASIIASVVVATSPVGDAVGVATGVVNAFLSSSTLYGGSAGRGLFLDIGNSGMVSVASVTFSSAARAFSLSTQAANFTLSIDSANFRGLAAGATAIHFLGGTFTATITAAGFEDTSVGANVSAAALDGASRITMRGQSGARKGTPYENDPQSLVWWENEVTPYPGCVVTNEVGAGKLYATIQAGVSALPSTLTGHSCVVIRDAATYNEQVTVQNFTNNGSSISIFTDPAVGSYAVLDPPSGSTAAFHILNSSVNLARVIVRPTIEVVAHGVASSSSTLFISSVNVDSGGMIWRAGLLVASGSTISWSSVTVQSASGIRLESALASRIEYSTASATSGSSNALYINGGATNTVHASWIYNAAGYGCAIVSNNNLIDRSTISVSGNGYGCELDGDENRIERSYMYSNNGAAFSNFASGKDNFVYLSTAVGAIGAQIGNGARNRLERSMFVGLSGRGIEILSAADATVVAFSTAVGSTDGLYVRGSSATVYNSYVQGSTAAFITRSTGTAIRDSALWSVTASGDALHLSSGSVNLTLSSTSLNASSGGRGLRLEAGNAGVVSLASVTFTGGARAIEVSTQGALFTLSVDSVNFRGLASGATAIHFLGGTFTATITAAGFEDTSVGANVSAASLDGASRMTMRSPTGARFGSDYENDPQGLVDWIGYESHPGCAVTRNAGAGMPYTTIQAAVNALPSTLTGHSCVVIRDAATYAEQVTVQNFTNGGSSISIIAAVGRPVIDPPAASTAAFHILNSSVNIVGIDIRPTVESLAFGVHASSTLVRLSSVNVDSGGRIWVAGMRLSSHNAVEYSSVTVQSAHGFWLPGSTMTTIAYSSAQARAVFFYPLYLAGASSNSFVSVLASGTLTYGAYLEEGANHNAITDSTMTGSGVGSYGLALWASSHNAVTRSYLHSAGWGFSAGGGSHGNVVRLSTAVGASGYAAAQVDGSFHTRLESSRFAGTGDGVVLEGGSAWNEVASSTMIVAGAALRALYVAASDSNTVTTSYIENASGHGVVLDAGADYNAVAQSTMVSTSSSHYALRVAGASSSAVSGCLIENAAGNAAGLEANARYTTISLTTMTTAGVNRVGLLLDASPDNTFDRVYSYSSSGAGAYLSNASHRLTISGSTFTSAAASYRGLLLDNVNDSSISSSVIRNTAGAGLEIYGARDEVRLSTIVAAGHGLRLIAVTTVTVTHSYIEGSTAAFVSQSTGAALVMSALTATAATGEALHLGGGSVNLALTSSTLLAPSTGRGLRLDAGGAGVVSLGSVTFTGAGRGVEVSTQGALFELAIDSANFRGLASGATAIHFLGGTFVATITAAGFEDAGVGANVSAAALDAGSRLTMRGFRGARTGPVFENDPQGLVDWVEDPYPGCVVTRNVGAGHPYATIQAGVNALPTTLTGRSCVVIRDAATYGEQVTVQGFTNAGSSITILTDPAAGAYAVLDPPADSTAAFRILNASVSVSGVRMIIDQAIPYGVWASSAHVQVSSVSISTSGGLGVYEAGIRMVSWSTVSYSTVVVWNAHGVWVDAGSRTYIAHSTVTTRHQDYSAVHLVNADSGVVTGAYLQNMLGRALYMLTGSDNNLVSLSTAVASNALGRAVVTVDGSRYNSFTSIRVETATTFGMHLTSLANGNQITQSTVTGANSLYHRLRISGASSNTITGSYLENAAGPGVRIDSVANYNRVEHSTVAAAASGAAGYALAFEASNWNTLADSRLTNFTGDNAMYIFNTSRDNTVERSTMVGGAYGFQMSQASSNTVVDSYIQGSTGAAVSRSTGAVFLRGHIVATAANGHALALPWASVNLSVTSTTLTAPSTGRGLSVLGLNTGVLAVASVTVTGAQYGVLLGTQSANFTIAADSVNFRGLASGATAIHFLGGTFVATITAAGFEDSTLGANVSAAALDGASRITMRGHSGARRGPDYENDPQGLVDWIGYEDYPGCAVTRNVGAGMPYATIQAGVNALPQTLTGHSCVVVRDAGPYAEQVTVQNFVNAGSSITILTHPDAGGPALVDPPTDSTAAFHVMNDSVNLAGFRIEPTVETVAFGVSVSSPYASITSVTVQGGTMVWDAAVRVSSWSAISYSSVTTAGADGFVITGGTVAVHASTGTGTGAAHSALVVQGISSVTVTGAYLISSGGNALEAQNGARGLVVARSSMSGSGYSIFFGQVTRSTVTESFVGNNGFRFDSNSGNGNVVSNSTISVLSGNAMYLQGNSYWIRDSYFRSASGSALMVNITAGTVIERSTFSTSGGGVNTVNLYAPGIRMDSSYVHAPSGTAIYLQGFSQAFQMTRSTAVSASGSGYALYHVNPAGGSTVADSMLVNTGGAALRRDGGAGYFTVLRSTVTGITNGIQLVSVTSTTVLDSYVAGATAAAVSFSTGFITGGSVFVSTSPGGTAVQVSSGVSVRLTTTTLTAAAAGAGLRVAEANSGIVSLASVTLSGMARGVLLSTPAANFELLIDSVNFRGLASGATAIHFLGGTFVATIAATGFEDSSIGANVSAAALDGASRITMRGSKGLRHGPGYENDPASLVDWPDLGPPSAPALWFVAASSGGLTYGTVGADGYTVQASTAADFTGVLHSSTAFNGEDRLAPTTLDPNTTYYFRAGSLWGGSTVYAQTTVSTPTLASLVSATTAYQVHVTSIVLNWAALPLAPPDASSKTSEGYLLEAADDIAFTNIVASSFTPNPALSTLTVNGLYGDATYYFRVGTLNWSGAVHYAVHAATYLPPVVGVDLTTISIVVPGGTPMNTQLVVTTATVVTNTGNVNEIYYLRVTTVSAGSPWFVGASPHADRYSAWAVFNSTQPAAGDFEGTDQLADGENDCSGAFSMGNEDCEQVPPGETRTLWMKLWTPLVTTTGNSQDIRLIVRPEYAR